jgi:hypothetical protein
MARVYKSVGTRSLVCTGCGQGFEAKRSDAKWCELCKTTGKDGRFARYETMRHHPCADCGKPCYRKATRCRACSNKLLNGLHVGEKSPSWKGGRSLRKKDGYWELRIDGQRLLEHRVVWEKANGPIPRGHVIHHLNGDKSDNRLENLDCTPRASHGPRLHADPTHYEARIRELESRLRELES